MTAIVLKLARRIANRIIQRVNRRFRPSPCTGARSSKGGKGETDEAEAESEATTEILRNPPFAAETPNLAIGSDGGKVNCGRDPALWRIPMSSGPLN